MAGTAPIVAGGETVAPGDAAAQTRRCLEIIRDALQALGAVLSHFVRTRIDLTRIEDWEAVSAVHGEFFAAIRPESTMVQVAPLIDPAWLVEIEAEAIVLE